MKEQGRSSEMMMGSKFAYISKRKMGIVKSKKESAPKPTEDRYASDDEASEGEMDDFMAAPMAPLPSPPPPPGAPPLASMPVSRASVPTSAPAPPKPHEEHKRKLRQEVDTNIVQIQLSALEHPGEPATGEPFFCQLCGAVLNLYSKPNIVKDEATHKSVWRCEFCNGTTEAVLEEEEIPKVGTLTYLVDKVAQPVAVAAAGAGAAVDQGKVSMEDDISVVFCIDVSGSMDAAKAVKDGKPMKYVKNKNYPTRLEGVKVAIDNQIEQMLKETPNRKIGFVTFENKVALIGDGTQTPVLFEGAKLDSNFFTIVEEAANHSAAHMGKPIRETCPALLQKLQAIRTGGSTALGPGLVVALSLAAQGKPGSKVIICTDGLANKGCGSLEGMTDKSAHMVREFYTQAAEYAKQHGVVVSFITLVESECRMDMLAPVANLSGGDILRVDPMKLSADFSAFLSEQVIATNVVVKIKIHKGLQFRNELEKNLSADRMTLIKEAGNANRDSVVTFEYCMKPPEELAAMKDIDFEKLAQLPFQSQISYRAMDGRKFLKVITQVQDITHEKDQAKEAINIDVVGTHAAIAAARLAERGDYKAAKANAYMYSNLSKAAAPQLEVKERVTGLYQAIRKQEVAAMPQMDELTSNINRAYKAKKK